MSKGMGGGTGTGASHVIAKAAREMNILKKLMVKFTFFYEDHENEKSY